MGSTILCVDDEANVLEALSRVFDDHEELSVITAGGADEALELLEAQPVDLVISDHVMPGTKGTVLLAKIAERYPDLPRIMITGYGDLADEAKQALGDVPVLAKPWDREELLREVRRRLSRRIDDSEHAALVEYCGVTPDQLERAQRVRSKMKHRLPLGDVLVEMGVVPRDAYQRVLRMRRAKLSLAAVLREDGHLSAKDYAAYESAKRESPGLSDRALLVDNQLVTEEQYLRALADKHDLKYVEPDIGTIDGAIYDKSSARYLLKHKALPLAVDGGQLKVILANPLDNHLIAELERIFGLPIVPCCCVEDKIVEALRTLDRLRGGGHPEEGSLQYREIDDVSTGEDAGQEAVEIVDYLLLRAIQMGASDLHIEPAQTKIRVRVRVDGVLQQLTELPIDIATRVASRIKILAGADIAEKRQHQDGKIFVKVEGREVDIRVSTYVSMFGETIVMRLLDRNRNLVAIDAIGFAPKIREMIENVVLPASSGLALITGPTGSGKTTTLYTIVEHGLDPSEKVITCEDPVEYVIDGVVQCSVNQKTGPTFAESLRAIVRQDPDVILVGEIRDEITAGLAFEAALTGHKVYSTFHTEDAVTVVVRLLEMKVEPFLVSSSLSAVIAQRLLRRLCPDCRHPAVPSRKQLRFLGLDKPKLQGARFWDAKGCARCDGTGYKGRLGVHEALLPDDDLRDAVLHRAAAKDLRAKARGLPEFMTLQEDALVKAAAGLTSVAEIVANVPRDIHVRPMSVLKSIAGTGGRE